MKRKLIYWATHHGNAGYDPRDLANMFRHDPGEGAGAAGF